MAATYSAQRTAQGHGRPGGEQDFQRARPGNPYEATPPKGNRPPPPGNLAAAIPGTSEARLPTGPYEDPKDSHAGPVGPPTVPVWQETSSSEWWRVATEKRYAPNPQGVLPEQAIGETHGMRAAPDPNWTPSPVIRPMWPPAGGQLYGRPFDKKMTERVSGYHGSMAGRHRVYQLQRGERPVHRLTSTYRIMPPSGDEVRAALRGEPSIHVVQEPDRSQNGTWRLF